MVLGYWSLIGFGRGYCIAATQSSGRWHFLLRRFKSQQSCFDFFAPAPINTHNRSVIGNATLGMLIPPNDPSSGNSISQDRRNVAVVVEIGRQASIASGR